MWTLSAHRESGTSAIISGLDEDPSWTPRWNIAASQLVPVLRRKTDRARLTFDLVRWGLISSWAKDLSIATKTINARSETAAEKPAFRDALRFRRCLIPADAFYDWQSGDRQQKQAFSIGMADDSTFAFAGLWESWTSPKREIVETCTHPDYHAKLSYDESSATHARGSEAK